MKVLQGLIDIGGQANRYARALNQEGVFAQSWFYERNIKSEPYNKLLDLSKNGFLNGRIRKLKYLTEALINFDVWHIHKGYSFLYDNKDLILAKNLNRKIIIHYRGSEIRKEMGAKFLTKEVISKIVRESKIADLILVKDGQLAELINPYIENSIVFPNIVDVSIVNNANKFYNYENKLKIVHIPSNPTVKGSEIIRKQIAKIRSQVIYEEFTNLSHSEVLQKYQESDLVIDQILTGTYGNSSLEAMAVGTPVLNCLNPLFTAYEPEMPPIFNIDESNICDVIISLDNNRNLIEKIGAKSKQFVEKYHSYQSVGKKLVKLYSDIDK